MNPKETGIQLDRAKSRIPIDEPNAKLLLNQLCTFCNSGIIIIKEIDLVVLHTLNEHFMPFNTEVVLELIFSFRSQRIASSIWRGVYFFDVAHPSQGMEP